MSPGPSAPAARRRREGPRARPGRRNPRGVAETPPPPVQAPSSRPPGQEGPHELLRTPLPRHTSTTGPRRAVAAGVVTALVTVALNLVAGRALDDVEPDGVLAPDGTPGLAVRAVVDIPLAAQVALAATAGLLVTGTVLWVHRRRNARRFGLG